MNKSKALRSSTRKCHSILLAVALLLSIPFAANAEQPSFVMATFVDSHHGTEIVSGEYAEAIEQIADENAEGESFFANSNLCVAYTKSGSLDAAKVACDSAVEQASKAAVVGAISPSRLLTDRARKSYLAVALSNRGVLRVVAGEVELARQDFVKALSVKPRTREATANLARLDSVSTQKA